MAEFNPNPDERQAEELFEFDPMSQHQARELREAEESGAESNGTAATDATTDQTRQSEQSGVEDFGYQKQDQNVDNQANKTGWRGKMRNAIKKGGPVATIAGALVGGSMLMSMVMTPALAINHFYELLVEKFNYQEFTNSIRVSRIGSMKWGKPDIIKAGGFGFKKARFKNLSEVQMKNFRKAGFKIDADEVTNPFFGKKSYKINSMELIDEPTGTNVKIGSVDEFQKAYTDNPVFRRQYKQATKGSFGQFSDAITDKIRQKLGLSKRSIDSTKTKADTDADDPNQSKADTDVDGDDAAKRSTKADLDDALDDAVNGKLDDFSDQTPKLNSDLDNAVAEAGESGSNANVNAAKATSEMLEEAGDTVKSGVKLKAGKVLGAVGNFLDVADNVCALAKVAGTAIYAGKVIFGTNLARYAFTFLATADKIRAGEATEEEIAYFGNKLMATRTFQDENGKVSYSNTAFDTFGYDYISDKYSTTPEPGYGTVGSPELDANALNYQIGAKGDLVDLYTMLLTEAGGFGENACDFVLSSTGQFTQAAVGLTAMVIGGGLTAIATGGVSLLAQVAWVAAQQVAMAGLKMYVAQKISATMTGSVVGSHTEGEDMGNALASGSGYAMGQISRAGANMPMDKESAVAYLHEYQTFIAETGEEIRATSSPFDVSSRHTMMGSIVASFLPQMAKMYSFTGKIGSLLQVAKSSLLNLTPVGNAASLVSNATYLNMCSDSTLPDAAFDPYCNPVLGLPTNQIRGAGYSPEEVIEYFESQPTSTFRKWFKPVDASGNDCYREDDREDYMYSTAAKDNECPDDYEWRINDLARNDGWLWDDCAETDSDGNCEADWVNQTNDSYAEREDEGGNPLYNYSLNCVYRPDDVPWGMSSIAGKEGNGFLSDSRKELGNATWRDVYDDGESCVIGNPSNDSEKLTMFSLYFMDERLQCIMDEGQDCQIEKNSYYDVSNSNSSSTNTGSGSRISSGTSQQKLAALFPGGVPTEEAQMNQYLTDVTVKAKDGNGQEKEFTLTVHQALAGDIELIMDKINQSGFPIKSMACYDWRQMATNSNNRSHHSYGVACDINPDENYCIKNNGEVCYKGIWKPGENKYSIPADGVVVKAFKDQGWSWGGEWNSLKDYMHFSYTGH